MINTMTDNRLSLFCLVDGQSTSNAFSVKPKLMDTIDDLKVLISARLEGDTLSKDLTLWRVSIPISDEDDNDLPVLLDTVLKKDKKKLSPATRLSKVFLADLLDETVHVIVQHPPPVHAPTPARPSTPQLKSVPMTHIEQELTVILNGVQHRPTTPSVDPMEVKASQSEELGHFFKRTLPYGETANDIKLVMLGLELDKQAKASDGKTTLRSIVEADIGKHSRSVVAMVAPSGSGKTATVIDLATNHFVIYGVCHSTRPTVSPEFGDPNFAQLAHDVEAMYATVAQTLGVSQSLLDVEASAYILVQKRVQLEFLARMLFLQLLLDRNPSLEPQKFFREQTTITGAATILELVKKLREYDSLAIQYMLDDVQTKLHSQLEPKRRGLVIALDEAQAAATSILAGKFISPSALSLYWTPHKPKSVLFDSKNEIQRHLRRGFLTPLSATLSLMKATLVILGTALSLQDADHVYTAVGKDTNFIKIMNFPRLNEDDIRKMLSNLVNMSECEIPHAKRRKLSGRPRFSLGIIKHLGATSSTLDSKQAILTRAVDKRIEDVKLDLRVGVRTILESDITGEASRLLCRMVLANHRQEPKISFSSKEQSDFVDKALCRLQPHPDGIHLIMDEPLVVEAVEEELKFSGKDPTFIEYMDQLNRLIENLGASSATKGEALEMLVRRSLQRFNGVPVADLPFLRGLSLPAWCGRFVLQINEINTASGFGYKGSGVTADLAFLTDCPPCKLLVAQSGTRPDGIWFFPDKQYAGSLAIKFYSNQVPQSMHKKNETSSDIRACFLKADGEKLNLTLTATRHAYVDAGIPSNVKGSLRIHLEFPHVQGLRPATHVSKDPKTGAEDVMVYINCGNMDSFFDEAIEAHRDDMIMLKKLINYAIEFSNKRRCRAYATADSRLRWLQERATLLKEHMVILRLKLGDTNRYLRKTVKINSSMEGKLDGFKDYRAAQALAQLIDQTCQEILQFRTKFDVYWLWSAPTCH
ncbi:hypothetical protein BGZ95_000502 [Linnemannia exigua]|uniref:Crinkler effector protein N-terminal domain-containing protein n=1 Tax=Linnemannia exigua TaxID=604196 RepID=A0AAD4D9X1_9FUNG|nr:hypothetical protein BGZ95_000502 [Linnemannia exigua]